MPALTEWRFEPRHARDGVRRQHRHSLRRLDRENLYNINKTTGVATVIGSTGLTTSSFINLGYDSDNDVMYATNTNTDSLYTINRATAAVTLVGPMTGTSNPHGLAYNFETDTMFLVDSSTDFLYKIDLNTGAVTQVGSTASTNLLGLAYIPEIPEPSGLAALGFLGIAALRRQRIQTR